MCVQKSSMKLCANKLLFIFKNEITYKLFTYKLYMYIHLTETYGENKCLMIN